MPASWSVHADLAKLLVRRGRKRSHRRSSAWIVVIHAADGRMSSCAKERLDAIVSQRLLDISSEALVLARIANEGPHRSRRHWQFLSRNPRSLEHFVPVVLEPIGGDDELRLSQRQRAVADLGVERVLGLVLGVGPDQVRRERT